MIFRYFGFLVSFLCIFLLCGLFLVLRNFSQEQQRSDIILQINKRFEKSFATEDSLTREQWRMGLASDFERRQMTQLIQLIFSLENFDNIHSSEQFLRPFSQLAKSVDISILGKYCIIHEKLDPTTGKFPRYWGYTVITSKQWAKRPYLHHSAAHFQSDGQVCSQAAVLFERTEARTLVVAGASRFAVKGNLTNYCQPANALADAAHNNLTMFHTMNVAIYLATLNIPDESDHQKVFIQWHGMANTSCPSSEVLVSAGARSSSAIYLDVNTPANKIVAAVNKVTGTKTANTPRMDTQCRLQATTNIFGKILNGVPADGSVCKTKYNPQDVTGQFLHIEQKEGTRSNWDLWSKAINIAFPLM